MEGHGRAEAAPWAMALSQRPYAGGIGVGRNPLERKPPIPGFSVNQCPHVSVSAASAGAGALFGRLAERAQQGVYLSQTTPAQGIVMLAIPVFRADVYNFFQFFHSVIPVGYGLQDGLFVHLAAPAHQRVIRRGQNRVRLHDFSSVC